MPINSVWEGIASVLADPNTGGGAGLLAPEYKDYLKAVLNVNNANESMADALAAAGKGSLTEGMNIPVSQSLSQIVAGGGNAPVAGGYNPADLKNLDGSTPGRDVLAGLNTTAGAGGLAALLGSVGAAVSRPGSWQERLGNTAAGMGRGAVAADAVKQLTDKLAASTPVTPPNAGQSGGANFPVAPLLLPPVLKLGQ